MSDNLNVVIPFLERSVRSIELRNQTTCLFGRYLAILRISGAQNADIRLSMLLQTILQEVNRIRSEFVRKEIDYDYMCHEELVQHMNTVSKRIEEISAIVDVQASNLLSFEPMDIE